MKISTATETKWGKLYGKSLMKQRLEAKTQADCTLKRKTKTKTTPSPTPKGPKAKNSRVNK